MPINQIMDLYSSFTLETLKIVDGDVQKSDYFLNCSIFAYYYRLREKLKYFKWKTPKKQ